MYFTIWPFQDRRRLVTGSRRVSPWRAGRGFKCGLAFWARAMEGTVVVVVGGGAPEKGFCWGVGWVGAVEVKGEGCVSASGF